MTLLAVDYSQVELRIMAHMTEEPTLIEAFQQGQDIHAATAAVIFEKPMEEVTKYDRNFAKRVNFGILYGMGAFRLARESNLTLAEARVFIDTYFSRLPNVLNYIEETKEMARTKGYVETLFGRKRFFPQLAREGAGRNEVQQAEREAIKVELGPAQRRVARLRAQLNRLERRAGYATVQVAVVTGEEAAVLKAGDKVLVTSKAFNPVLVKI